MKRVYRCSDIPTLIKRDIFFDANILMYLYFSPPGMGDWVEKYGAVFRSLLDNRNRFYIDFNVLSEVVNRELRLSYKNYCVEEVRDIKKYKQWRGSQQGITAEQRTYTIIKQILSCFIVDGKVFGLSEIQKMLLPVNLDFTDKAIVDLCRTKGYVLLTNDADFAGEELEILTENPRLK